RGGWRRGAPRDRVRLRDRSCRRRYRRTLRTALRADAADVAGQVVFAVRALRTLSDRLHAVPPARKDECGPREDERKDKPDRDLHRGSGGRRPVQRLADALLEVAAQRSVRGSLQERWNDQERRDKRF